MAAEGQDRGWRQFWHLRLFKEWNCQIRWPKVTFLSAEHKALTFQTPGHFQRSKGSEKKSVTSAHLHPPPCSQLSES